MSTKQIEELMAGFMIDVKQAQAAQARYQQGGGIQALDEAIAAWERILTHAEFSRVDERFRLFVLNDSATIYLRRYWAANDLTDLDTALHCWQQLKTKLPQDSQYLPSILNNLGTSLKDRYQRTGEAKDLERGIEAFQQAVALTQKHFPNSPDLPMSLDNLGTGLTDRYQRTGEVKDLERGFEAFQQAVALTQKHFPNSPELPGYLNNLGNGLWSCCQRTGEVKDLERGIEAFQQAVALTKKHFPNSPDLPRFLNNLGTGLSNRYARTGEVKDLEQSIQVKQQAVALIQKHFSNFPELPGYLNNLGAGLSNRYARTGEVKDLERGIEAFQQAVALTQKHFPNSPGLPAYFNNLGTGLSNRYDRTDEVKDLERGIEVFQQAVALTQKYFPNSPDLPKFLNNLGNGLNKRYARTGEVKNLERGIEAFQQAVALTQKHFPNSPGLPAYFNNLGTGLSNRYARTDEVKDLERGIEVFQQAVALTQKHFPNSPDFPKFLNNLGNGLNNRYARTGEVKDLERGIEAFQQATQQGLDIDTNASLTSARNWLRRAFNRQAWDEVVQAYESAYQASTRLVQIQSTRQHQESWLKESQGLATHTAYALAKENRLTKAIVTLERGLAQLLSEALAHERAELEQLKVIGQADLYNHYQQAIADWHDTRQFANSLEIPTDEQSQLIQQRLRAAREALNKTIVAIRKVEGYANFLMAPEFADIVAAVKSSTLVYLVVTKAGGLALIVNENEKITPVWLPELTEKNLEHTLANMEPPDTGYLRAYNDWLTHPKEDTYYQQWFNSLEKTTQLLRKQVMAPVIQALQKSAQVTLIPVGRLGLLPFHAAWTEDKNTPTGKRYALDELTISYAPNARSLTEARKIADGVTVDRMLAVDEPKPVTNEKGEALPLPSSEYEVQTVVANFAHHQIFKHEAATRQTILDALANCTVLHFSCHGSANLNKPLESALIMANNEPLTVKDFLDLRLKGIRLATLSACETGIPGIKLPEEVVNLPTGLLQAGVAGVVASLWSVSDISTALLMTKFYQNVTTLWQQQGTQASIASALQAAQCWLRDATKEELEQRIKELPIDATQKRELRRLFKKIKPQTRPYQDSYYWAAFSAIGV